MSRRILGLDIRRDSLTAVLIQTTLQGHVIEGLAYIEAGQGVQTSEPGSMDLVEHVPETDGDGRGERLLAMFETLAQTMDLSSADCYVSFPAIDMSFRTLSVPFTNKKKIQQILPFELEPVIPGNVDDLTLDFITRDRGEEDEESQVVAAAVNTALLESFESCLKRAGLSVFAIVPGGSSAVEFLMRNNTDTSDYLFLDMGHRSSTLFMIRDKQIAGIRSFGAEGGHDTGLNVSRTVLAYCEQYVPDYQPTELYLAGPGSRAPGVDDVLSKICDLPVVSLNVLEPMGLTLDERIGDRWDDALYMNATALCHAGLFGIKGLRLTERYEALGKYLADYRDQIIRTGFFLALVIVALLVNVGYESYSTSRSISALDRQMVAIYKEVFPSATQIADPYAQMAGKIREERKKSAFADSNAGNIRIIDLINDISKALPSTMDIEFTRFVLGSEDLKISGSTDTYATVDTMKKKLEEIDYFKSVVITSTSGERSENQVQFKFKIEF